MTNTMTKTQSSSTSTDSQDESLEAEKRRIWRNVLALGVAFMVHFTAFWGASNLQSSVNAEAGLGTITLAAIYASLLLSNILLPAMVIKWLGIKWTIVVSLLTYTPFMLAQMHPRFFTMVPAGLAIGLGGGPLWCAKCTYLSVAAQAYARLGGASTEQGGATQATADRVVTRFFGVFFMFYSCSQVWGNLISSAVLSTGGDELLSNATSTSIFANSSTSTNNLDIVLAACGANFCPNNVVTTATADSTGPVLAPPSPGKIRTIALIYLACMLFAAGLVVVAVDPSDRYDKNRKSEEKKGPSGVKLLAVTLKQLGDLKQLLILPITMFIGAEQAFLAADYTAAFVSCSWSVSMVGFVMVAFGVCDAVASAVVGGIARTLGRPPLVCLALALHAALIITLLVWRPTADRPIPFFVIAGLWGVCDALWLVQINSLSGTMFPGKEEAAYSNFRLWESTGSVLTYAISPYLCTESIVYWLLVLLLVGSTGYAAVEWMERDLWYPGRGRRKVQIVSKNRRTDHVESSVD
nr:unnamed protein product [Callosobruchus analis]